MHDVADPSSPVNRVMLRELSFIDDWNIDAIIVGDMKRRAGVLAARLHDRFGPVNRDCGAVPFYAQAQRLAEWLEMFCVPDGRYEERAAGLASHARRGRRGAGSTASP